MFKSGGQRNAIFSGHGGRRSLCPLGTLLNKLLLESRSRNCKSLFIPITQKALASSLRGSQSISLSFLFERQAFFNFFFSLCCCLVPKSCLTLCGPMGCSMPGLLVHHQLPGLTQTHAHWVSDAIQPSHPLPSPSPPVFNLSQHQSLLKWVSSSHQVAKVLEFQLQHQSFQWIFRADFLSSPFTFILS